jgi:hypothetical protein
MFKNELKIKGNSRYKWSGWKYSAGVRFLLFLLLAALFFAAMAGTIIPKTYDIEKGMVSEKPIYAPRQIENPVETEKAKEEAAQAVQPVYRIVPIKNEVIVEKLFEKLRQINLDINISTADKVSIYRTVLPTLISDYLADFVKSLRSTGQYHETLLLEVQRKLNDQLYRIPEEAYFKFPRLTKEDLDAMEPAAVEIVGKLMSDQITDAQTARTKAAELVNASSLTQALSRELVQEIVRAAVTPNTFFDQRGTEQAKNEAREKTKPVYINKNELLVAKGQIITDDIYKLLEDADLLKSNASYWPHLGLAIFSLLLVGMLYMYVRLGAPSVFQSNVPLLMLLCIYAADIVAMNIVASAQSLEYPFIGYVAPVAMGSILIAILLNMNLAYFSSLLFGVLASVIFNQDHDRLFDFRFGAVFIIASIAAIFSLHQANRRMAIVRAGLVVALFAAVGNVSLMLLGEPTNKSMMLYATSLAAAGGVLTAVLVIGLLPFFESLFGILSPLKLLDLSNPNHPLLRKLLTETPGTYHHSVMVGNLSEAAAEAIGADGLLCRVGSFYHDIGKTKRPSYFIENQTNIENPHDRIDPYLSKSIIIAHARDGVEMLKEHKIPKPIRDIAEQHHGTTLLHYFYHKALKQYERDPDKTVNESDFRYPGPKAQTKEAAIVGIADSVEAAVRSLRNPTVEQIDSMVRKIIKSRLDDGQFNECDLTLKELDTIGKSMKETLIGIFHSRIEYPPEAGSEEADGENELKGAQRA